MSTKYEIHLLTNRETIRLDVTSNPLHYDDNSRVRQRMLKCVCKEYGAARATLLKLENGRTIEVDKYLPTDDIL